MGRGSVDETGPNGGIAIVWAIGAQFFFFFFFWLLTIVSLFITNDANDYHHDNYDCHVTTGR